MFSPLNKVCYRVFKPAGMRTVCSSSSTPLFPMKHNFPRDAGLYVRGRCNITVMVDGKSEVAGPRGPSWLERGPAIKVTFEIVELLC